MKVRDEFKPISIEDRLAKFKGVTVIEEYDLKTGEVKNRVEKQNTMTGMVAGIFGKGNYNLITDPSNVLPIVDKLFGGVVITDSDNTASQMCIANNTNITAMAGDDAYSSSTPSARGSYSAESSGYFEDENGHGYQKVWTWTDRQGMLNGGKLKSVCLCPPHIGKVAFSDNSVPASGTPFDHVIGSKKCYDTDLQVTQVIDYQNNKAYKITYDSTVGSEQFVIDVFEFNGDLYHLMGGSLSQGRSIGQYTISGAKTYNTTNIVFDEKAGVIHILNYQSGSNTLKDMALDLSDGTTSTTSHTFPGVQFSVSEYPSNSIALNKMVIHDGYLWTYSHSGRKIMRCDLSQDANVDDFDNPLYTVAGISTPLVGPCFVLPNDDIIFTRQGTKNALAVWYHNSSFYLIYFADSEDSETYNHTWRAYNTGYGNFIEYYHSGDYGRYFRIATIFPMVTTVNNLDSLITRTPGLGLKVTYKLYEQEPS